MIDSPHHPKQVAILLCTYHGEDYLKEQLASIQQQTYPHWSLYASDDSKNTHTHAILDNFQKHSHNPVHLRKGPQKGFASNFLALACDTAIQAPYYAFSDQDDRWEPDKLTRALAWLDTIDPTIPALYCSRSKLIDANGNSLGLSTYFKRKPSFANALVQNIAGGNTMVFNQALKELLCKAGAEIDVPAHDWWVYLMITGCEGKIYYDATPTIEYRQHANNLIGFKTGFLNRLQSIRMLFKGRFKHYNDKHIHSLESIKTLLTPPNQAILNDFILARKSSLFNRVRALYRARLYRQTWMGNVGLVVAAMVNRI